MINAIDPYFRVEVLSRSADPQTTVWQASHQDYSCKYVFDVQSPGEARCGEIAVRHLLGGNRGHYGPLEHPQIVFSCGWFPHSVMQQVRTHRTLSFDVQSFRYTGSHIYELGRDIASATDEQINQSFYLRPVGQYTDRNGKKYEYTEADRSEDIAYLRAATVYYARSIDKGFSEEHARSLIPFDVRQHWVLSGNLRSLMHLMDLRAKDDAQLECQQLCDLIFPHFENWVPEIADWYKKNRWGKARLAP